MPKYIKNSVVSMPIPFVNNDNEPQLFPEVLAWLCGLYQPTKEFQLHTLNERRSLNRAMDRLEATTRDYCVLDNDEFKVIRPVVEHVGLALLQGLDRNLPAIIDALDAAPDEVPDGGISNLSL
jgi:hypothetical protein